MIPRGGRRERLRAVRADWFKSGRGGSRASAGKPAQRGKTTRPAGKLPVMPRQGMIAHCGNIPAGTINHRSISVSGQAVRHDKTAGVPGSVRQFAHRHGMNRPVRRRFDSCRINAAVNEVTMRVHCPVIIHPRTMEKAVGIMAVPEMLKRMPAAEIVVIAKREAG
jgi:hypothetical protein